MDKARPSQCDFIITDLVIVPIHVWISRYQEKGKVFNFGYLHGVYYMMTIVTIVESQYTIAIDNSAV